LLAIFTAEMLPAKAMGNPHKPWQHRGVLLETLDASMRPHECLLGKIVGRKVVPCNSADEGAVHVLVDITEQRQMEEELRRSQDELELRFQERTADSSKGPSN
jgi:hypothetical protein